MEPAPGATRTIHIDNATWPCRWIKWANIILVSSIVLFPLRLLSSLVKGDAESAAYWAAFFAVFAFPGWIAWKNIDVVRSVGQRYTIRTLVFCGTVFMLAAAALVVTDPVLGLLLGANTGIPGILAFGAAVAVAMLRRRAVDGLGIPLRVLVADVEALQEGSRPRRLRAQRPLLGWLLVAAAIAIWLAGDFFWPDSPASRDLSRFAFLLVVFARANFQPTAADLLQDDPRPPVLLLRSFLDDEKINWRNATRSFVDASLESRLTSHFARVGPFIAVGAPADDVPVIGAARAELSDAEWKDQVVAWIAGARVVLIMAGATRWVNWELEQVIAHGRVDRLIVCFPPLAGRWIGRLWHRFGPDMAERLARLREAFAASPWAGALNRLDDASTLRSVTFGADGRVTVVRSRSRDRNAYHLAVLVAHWVIAREVAPPSSVASPSTRATVAGA